MTEVLYLLLELQNHSLIEVVAVVCWSLWNHRNAHVHGKPVTDPRELYKTALSYLEEIQSSQGFQSFSTQQQLKWEPPPIGYYKINADGAVFETEIKAE